MAEISTTHCAYFLCSKNERNSPGLRRFYFPVHDELRCEKWIASSGNSLLLQLSPRKLKKRFLCQDHFRTEDFLAKKLVKTAVPIQYSLREVPASCYLASTSGDITSAAISDIESLPSTSEIVHRSPPSSSNEKGDNILKEIANLPILESPRTKNLKRKLKDSMEAITTMKRDLKKQKLISTSLRDLNMLPPFPRALIRMQLAHKKRQPWLSDERTVALSLFYKSPSTYKFLRTKGTILPSPSSLSTWLKSFSYKPGLNKKMMYCLKLKAETMSIKSKQCVITFDEMAIKQCVEFSKAKGYIEGLEDLGKFGRKPVLAKQALVFLARGIYTSWKIPLVFYFSGNGVSAEKLCMIIKDVLETVKTAGLEVLATICDQASTNQKAYRMLGVQIEEPYFLHNGSKYYAIFDAPHIIKNIRNNLLQGNFVWEEKVISFDYIRKLYELDKESKTGKSLCKLTDNHINPGPFQKMTVKLAVQVLSHSVAAALNTAIETGQMDEQARYTADFIEIIDSTFDSLNSRNVKDKKKCRCALSKKNVHAFEALQKAKAVMGSIAKIDKHGNLKRVACFQGMIQTINAVEMLFQDQCLKGYEFLLTIRLNQDIIENFFSVLRQRGGYNKNPSVRMFQAAFKSNCVINLMKAPKTSNTEPLEVSNLLEGLQFSEDVSDQSSEEDAGSSSSSSEFLSVEEDTSLEDCAVVYFAGYLAKKCIDNFQCDHCNSYLISSEPLTDSTDILLFYKNYNINNPSALKKPTTIQTQFTKFCMSQFSKLFYKFWEKRNVYHLLKTKILGKLRKKNNEWYACPTECVIHRDFIFDLLLRTLLYKECKQMTGNLKSQKHQKIQILRNL